MSELLVVAGEASGDRAAAQVVSELSGLGLANVRVFGMGGSSLEAQGVELVSDLRASTALGVTDVAARACAIGVAYAAVARAARKRKASAALLVNYTEFNTVLAARLHARGVRILWYGAPQIWAWREGRARPLRRTVDRMAVMLPFEEALWRERGVDAEYVGHPARETRSLTRTEAREALGLTPYARAVALLPGSRPHEVKRLLGPMLEAYERVRHDRGSIDGRVLLAPSLDEATRVWALEAASKLGVEVVEVDGRVGAAPCLRAFDASLCASGTAALEAALARAVPVIVYRVDLLTELAARRLLRTPQIALPNVLLGRAAFAELVQREVQPKKIAQALARALDARTSLVRACDAVDEALGPRHRPSSDVARMLRPWLA
ncbi:MAG: lipid-A-disaccharide synthase [Polyangiaceae bacterium]